MIASGSSIFLSRRYFMTFVSTDIFYLWGNFHLSFLLLEAMVRLALEFFLVCTIVHNVRSCIFWKMFNFNFKKPKFTKERPPAFWVKIEKKTNWTQFSPAMLVEYFKNRNKSQIGSPQCTVHTLSRKYSESHHKNRACIMVRAEATVQYMLGFLARYVETKAEHSL